MKGGHLIAIALTAMPAAVAPAAAMAADAYPVRAMTVVVPLAPGTTADFLARLFSDRLSGRLGQQVVVQNRPGAGGLIAAQAVASAPADGYTLLLANSGHTILGTLNKDLPFDPVRDFTGVAMIGEAAAIVAVPPSLGPRNLGAFVELARAAPGTVNYASAGIGTSTHLAGAYFAHAAGISMVHVPYRTGSTLIADLVAGRVQVTFAPAAFILPMLQDGKLLALAVSSSQPMRSPVAVPTAHASGIDYDYATWYGLLAPANTPATILQTLSTAMSELGRDAELKGRIIAQGIEPRALVLADFDAHIRRDMERLAPLMKSLGGELGN
jgi:tripartite-type tricarboxylate transporter receptor subunit TctC